MSSTRSLRSDTYWNQAAAGLLEMLPLAVSNSCCELIVGFVGPNRFLHPVMKANVGQLKRTAIAFVAQDDTPFPGEKRSVVIAA